MLIWLGRGYLVYHAIVAALLVVSFLADTRPGYWREAGAVGELGLLLVLYPLFVPALAVSGGPHNLRGGLPMLAAVPVLFVTVVAAGSGVWLVVRRGGRRKDA